MKITAVTKKMTAADSIKKILHTCKILAVVWATTNFVPNCLVWLVNVKIVSSTYKEYIIRITKKNKTEVLRLPGWGQTHFRVFVIIDPLWLFRKGTSNPLDQPLQKIPWQQAVLVAHRNGVPLWSNNSRYWMGKKSCQQPSNYDRAI